MDFLAATFRQKTLAECNAWLSKIDVCFGPVNTLPEALADANLAARGMVTRDAAGRTHVGSAIRFRNEPAKPVLRAPALGEHTAPILDEIRSTAPQG
jgi:crotonobetainyl-CoA:carnitine CoA-transferase CaiB-like acyl-CoA transferase